VTLSPGLLVRSLRPRDLYALDALLAVALTFACVLAASESPASGGWREPVGITLLTALLIGAPAALRRLRPVPVAALSLVVSAAALVSGIITDYASGSIVAVLLWGDFARFVRDSPSPLLITLLAGIVLSIAIGIPAATIVARESGRHDPGFVVIDEVAGQWIALLGSPADWRHALIALVLFRLFDITKPFPARQLERLPAGWGIVFDDVAAGLYAWGVAAVLRIWI